MAQTPEQIATTLAVALKYGCTLAIEINANDPLKPVKFIPVFSSILLLFCCWLVNFILNNKKSVVNNNGTI